MLRTVAGSIFMLFAAVALVGEAHALSGMVEQAAIAFELLDEVAILIAILGACLLIDKASWSFLTGQKTPDTGAMAKADRGHANPEKRAGS